MMIAALSFKGQLLWVAQRKQSVVISHSRTLTHVYLICHDGKYLATHLPSVGSLRTLGKCLHQRHVHSVVIRVFITGDLAAHHI